MKPWTAVDKFRWDRGAERDCWVWVFNCFVREAAYTHSRSETTPHKIGSMRDTIRLILFRSMGG